MPRLDHANTDPTLPTLTRPAMTTAKSTSVVPSPHAEQTLVTEFGQVHASQPIASASTLPARLVASESVSRKRRSFLNVDGPPSLNVQIPSVSPFMPSAGSSEGDEVDQASQSGNGGILDGHQERETHVNLLADSPVEMPDVDFVYAASLTSIKSYLRDLFDLSRPPLEPTGGFEIIRPASGSEGSISPIFGEAARRPNASRMKTEPQFASASHDHELPAAPTVKDDPAKRARVLREIYDTEKTYVRGLGELVSIYVRPAAQPSSSKSSAESVIPPTERKVVFGPIESITTMHRQSLLPAIEDAVRQLLEFHDDPAGGLSRSTAHALGDVFRTYIAYMKQYSTYINNFDNALTRLKTWSVSTNPAPSTLFGKSSPSPSTSPVAGELASSSQGPAQMSSAQRKRVQTFLKVSIRFWRGLWLNSQRCKEHPRHSQINLESYLLLPIQRVPRYKLLLEDLASCTPFEGNEGEGLAEALREITQLASLMNEEKREAESRLRLWNWQKRIAMRGPSPLVQPHRKLLLDGRLNLARLIKKGAVFVEVETLQADGEDTLTNTKAVVPVEHILPEPIEREVSLILCTDLLVVVTARNAEWGGPVDLFNVLRMGTSREPASIVHGNILRVVDNKVGRYICKVAPIDTQSIYYFDGAELSVIVQWCRAINSLRHR